MKNAFPERPALCSNPLNRLKELLLLVSLPLILLATLYLLVALFWILLILLAAATKISGLLVLPAIYTIVPSTLWDNLGLPIISRLPSDEIAILTVGYGWPQAAWAFIHTAASHALAVSWPYLLALAALWLWAGYRYHRRWGEIAFHLDVLPPGAAPWVEADIAALARAARLPVPRLSIWATEAPNAFASGLDDKTYKITVTVGLLQQLSRDEIRAVLAHELGHIAAGDVRLMTLSYVYGGIFNAIADYLWLNVLHSVRGDNTVYNRLFLSVPLVALVALVLNIAGAFATLIRFALVRGREYQADRFAARLTGDGAPLASALGRIAAYKAPPPKVRIVRDSVIHLPPARWWQGWTATHPPIPARQKALLGQ